MAVEHDNIGVCGFCLNDNSAIGTGVALPFSKTSGNSTDRSTEFNFHNRRDVVGELRVAPTHPGHMKESPVRG